MITLHVCGHSSLYNSFPEGLNCQAISAVNNFLELREMSNQTFSGVPNELLIFLADLKTHNKKSWFDKNRARYESIYRAPAKAFCEAMTPRLQKLTRVEHNSKIFRINRDLRFSKDKTPYNTHLHISFTPSNGGKPAWSFGLSESYLSVGVGSFGFENNELESYRARVAGKAGKTLAINLDTLIAQGARIGEPELKRVPNEFPPDHARAQLLRRKSLAVWLDFKNPQAATKPSMVEDCIGKYRTLKPIFDWLADL